MEEERRSFFFSSIFLGGCYSVPRSSWPDSLTERRLGFAGSRKERRKNGGIAMNPTGMKVICFSRFFYAFLYLCCLQTCVRVLWFVCIRS